MLTWVAKKLFGTSNERSIRRMRPMVSAISDLEPKMEKLTDDELRQKTAEFKEKLDNGATLDDILVEAFAVCREGGKRALKMRHYDVQLIGGMVLHNGKIAEMKTGEGKTLVATLAIYLNALEGKGVHLVTVNDYLAKRDAEWMGKLYNFLGLTVGVVIPQQSENEKKRAYLSDITYGQNNEFGFDYLRDNLKFSALDYAQRPLNFAIVDEVDSILIDEARTPLIISGPAEAASEKYRTLNEVVAKLRKDEHYNVDEKAFSVTLTDDGVEFVQKLIGISNLYDPTNVQTLHILNQLLKAHALYKRDQHYMVSPDGKVLIIDEFTGRVLAGRRWSDGLHQAVEAKENVRIQEESRTIATITFQNLFRMYNKLGGMTGTAETEAAEFHSTYKLDVVAVPTNKPMIRADEHDVVYKTEREKFTAVIEEILRAHEEGRPVLVGTTSVEKSAAIARILAKRRSRTTSSTPSTTRTRHSSSRRRVARRRITVSTNMAGRGTDILLGRQPGDARALGVQGDRQGPRRRHRRVRGRWSKKFEGSCAKEHDEVIEHRRASHRGHRAPRVPPHRQPAARPRRSPGRSRLEPLLPVARRRPDAHLRRRPGEEPDGPHGHARRRAHRAPLGHQERRERPAQGRGAQLRHPQEPPRVRRRDERAAQDRLLAAPAAPARPLRTRRSRRARQAHRGHPRDRPSTDAIGKQVAPLVGQAPRHVRAIRRIDLREKYNESGSERNASAIRSARISRKSKSSSSSKPCSARPTSSGASARRGVAQEAHRRRHATTTLVDLVQRGPVRAARAHAQSHRPRRQRHRRRELPREQAAGRLGLGQHPRRLPRALQGQAAEGARRARRPGAPGRELYSIA